jgi:hypothetical protein
MASGLQEPGPDRTQLAKRRFNRLSSVAGKR